MKIAVLFDGAGLSRLGLELAGHDCTGFELDPAKHHLSTFIGSGNCVLADATRVDLEPYEAIWMSPPCQTRSSARTQGSPTSQYAADLLDWALSITVSYPDKLTWIENVLPQGETPIWGRRYNAAQFLQSPIQNRPRMIGGRHPAPTVYRHYKSSYSELNLCPTITATEYKGCASDTRRASRYYGRRLTEVECAFHQGLKIPREWRTKPDWYTPAKSRHPFNWTHQIYEAIGNGVPVYMARAFGEACGVSNSPFAVYSHETKRYYC
jgi:site-specific DNA-cytosine methylase